LKTCNRSKLLGARRFGLPDQCCAETTIGEQAGEQHDGESDRHNTEVLWSEQPRDDDAAHEPDQEDRDAAGADNDDARESAATQLVARDLL
jgi:hypothetical protein